jgi:hypothetical protein
MAINIVTGGYGTTELMDPRYQLRDMLDPNNALMAEANRRGVSPSQIMQERQLQGVSAQNGISTSQAWQAMGGGGYPKKMTRPAHLQKPDPSTIGSLRPITFDGEGRMPIVGTYGGGFSPEAMALRQTTNGASGGIGGLLDQQRAENRNSRDMTERNWQEGKNLLLSLMGKYEADPMNKGARSLAQRLLNNPESINDNTQSLIRNQLMNQLGAQAEATRRRQTSSLASRGQLNPAAMSRMNSSLNAQEDAALSRAMAGTEIQRALQRNQDITNASQLGRNLGMDKAGLNMGVSNAFLENMPQYMPEDLSGLAALLFGNKNSGGVGGGGGGNFGYSFLGGSQNSPNAGQNNLFGFQTGALNPWGQQSPGQTGFAPGLRGNYQWTGQPSYGGANAGLQPTINAYDPNAYGNYAGLANVAGSMSADNWDPNQYYATLR